MGKSGNPATRASNLKVSSAADFKKRVTGIFELPSGMVVKLRNPGGLKAFVDAGTIPNSLMPIVDNALKGNKTTADDIKATPEDVSLKMVEEMVNFLDVLNIKCWVEPKLNPVPENDEDRDDDLVYVDEVEDMDKMFVFQWLAGGTKDLERFRQQYSQDLESLG